MCTTRRKDGHGKTDCLRRGNSTKGCRKSRALRGVSHEHGARILWPRPAAEEPEHAGAARHAGALLASPGPDDRRCVAGTVDITHDRSRSTRRRRALTPPTPPTPPPPPPLRTPTSSSASWRRASSTRSWPAARRSTTPPTVGLPAHRHRVRRPGWRAGVCTEPASTEVREPAPPPCLRRARRPCVRAAFAPCCPFASPCASRRSLRRWCRRWRRSSHARLPPLCVPGRRSTWSPTSSCSTTDVCMQHNRRLHAARHSCSMSSRRPPARDEPDGRAAGGRRHHGRRHISS